MGGGEGAQEGKIEPQMGADGGGWGLAGGLFPFHRSIRVVACGGGRDGGGVGGGWSRGGVFWGLGVLQVAFCRLWRAWVRWLRIRSWRLLAAAAQRRSVG